jgi:hypothetical protein
MPSELNPSDAPDSSDETHSPGLAAIGVSPRQQRALSHLTTAMGTSLPKPECIREGLRLCDKWDKEMKGRPSAARSAVREQMAPVRASIREFQAQWRRESRLARLAASRATQARAAALLRSGNHSRESSAPPARRMRSTTRGSPSRLSDDEDSDPHSLAEVAA